MHGSRMLGHAAGGQASWLTALLCLTLDDAFKSSCVCVGAATNSVRLAALYESVVRGVGYDLPLDASLN